QRRPVRAHQLGRFGCARLPMSFDKRRKKSRHQEGGVIRSARLPKPARRICTAKGVLAFPSPEKSWAGGRKPTPRGPSRAYPPHERHVRIIGVALEVW